MRYNATTQDQRVQDLITLITLILRNCKGSAKNASIPEPGTSKYLICPTCFLTFGWKTKYNATVLDQYVQGAIDLSPCICMENTIQCNHSGPTDSGFDYWGAGVPQPGQKYPGSCRRRRGCPESDICLRNDQLTRHKQSRKKLDVCPPPQEHVRPRCHLRSLGGMGDEFRLVTIG